MGGGVKRGLFKLGEKQHLCAGGTGLIQRETGGWGGNKEVLLGAAACWGASFPQASKSPFSFSFQLTDSNRVLLGETRKEGKDSQKRVGSPRL